MSIKQLDHDDGIRILIKLLYEGKLTPIIGSGFTMGCQSKKKQMSLMEKKQRKLCSAS